MASEDVVAQWWQYLIGSILPAMSSMLSEEGACYPHRNSPKETNKIKTQK